MERIAAQDFEGTEEELESLLLEGLASKELSEERFWKAVDSQTSLLLSARNNKAPS